MLVDIHAKNRRRAPEFVPKAFYGQLQNIFVVQLPASPELELDEPTTLILAGIQSCELDKQISALKMPLYSKMGRYEVVDMSCVQCLVGRVYDGKRWAIIDRSGDLQRSFYVPDE